MQNFRIKFCIGSFYALSQGTPPACLEKVHRLIFLLFHPFFLGGADRRAPSIRALAAHFNKKRDERSPMTLLRVTLDVFDDDSVENDKAEDSSSGALVFY